MHSQFSELKYFWSFLENSTFWHAEANKLRVVKSAIEYFRIVVQGLRLLRYDLRLYLSLE